jgi:hypothetical protein
MHCNLHFVKLFAQIRLAEVGSRIDVRFRETSDGRRLVGSIT